jgi:hypothetical protein
MSVGEILLGVAAVITALGSWPRHKHRKEAEQTLDNTTETAKAMGRIEGLLSAHVTQDAESFHELRELIEEIR